MRAQQPGRLRFRGWDLVTCPFSPRFARKSPANLRFRILKAMRPPVNHRRVLLCPEVTRRATMRGIGRVAEPFMRPSTVQERKFAFLGSQLCGDPADD